MVMHDPSVKARFRAIRGELEAELAADPASQLARLEWVGLNIEIGDGEQVLEWVDAGMPGLAPPQNEEDARISEKFLMQMDHLLAQSGRWLALSRLIHDPMKTAQSRVETLLRQAGAEIEAIEPLKSTLEEFFIEVAKGPDNAASGKGA